MLLLFSPGQDCYAEVECQLNFSFVSSLFVAVVESLKHI